MAAIPYLERPVFPDITTRYTAASIRTQRHPPDVASFIRAKTDFFAGIWVDSDALDYRFRLELLAPSLTQTPRVIRNIMGRPQDPAKLLEALRTGTPLLMLYGDEDQLLDCERTKQLMEPHCAAMTVHIVRGAGHAPFYEHRGEFVAEVLRFVRRAVKTSR